MYDVGDSSRIHPSTMPHVPPIPVANSNATRTPSASYTIPAPAPTYPSADYRREPPTGPRASIYSAAIPPPPPPATVAPLPAFAQAFPPDQQVGCFHPRNFGLLFAVPQYIMGIDRQYTGTHEDSDYAFASTNRCVTSRQASCFHSTGVFPFSPHVQNFTCRCRDGSYSLLGTPVD